MATQAPPEPQVPQPNGIPKISARKPHFGGSAKHIYDTVCVGFGTVGLGLAVALSDLTLDSLSNVLFLERSPRFSSNTASEEEYMQTTFAQDLVTLRCPTSPYTFLNYLAEKQSLESFLSSSNSLSPTRKAFGEYLEWSAEQFKDVVVYGEKVVNVEAVSIQGAGKLWVVTIQNTQTRDLGTLVCKRVVFATGREAKLARLSWKYEDFEKTGSTEVLPAIEQMREFCSPQSSQDEVLSTLAISSGKIAVSLMFESEGNTKRAAL
ncbi:uncharacterized protein PAC_05250 [Phialocephala subalpina]|uniref:L-ornithine N(5)-monooxygenase [NAD(P)H] n=1 Tax=Phialocephala subalpina TaxID=576137 RepID=A0A1L7WRG5_9HELO|nr:uncharacterized protein PAC_05250 [Phialocephala subalpina]